MAVRLSFGHPTAELCYVGRRVFDDIQSKWKIRKLYERHPRFVSPETVNIGKNRVKNKYNRAQYISIEKTIQSLVLDPEFAEVLLGKSKVDRMNMYACIC